MKYAAASSILVLWLVPGAPALQAASVECGVPPGPSGRIICSGPYVAMCQANGRRIKGQCLPEVGEGVSKSLEFTGENLRRFRNANLLEQLSNRSPSASELREFTAAMEDGRLQVGDSVYTFNFNDEATYKAHLTAALEAPTSSWQQVARDSLIIGGAVGLLVGLVPILARFSARIRSKTR